MSDLKALASSLLARLSANRPFRIRSILSLGGEKNSPTFLFVSIVNMLKLSFCLSRKRRIPRVDTAKLISISPGGGGPREEVRGRLELLRTAPPRPLPSFQPQRRLGRNRGIMQPGDNYLVSRNNLNRNNTFGTRQDDP